ncbi:MAG: sigma-70 family RNA polymerase sigma factor [Enhygromyxa sp.]
MSASVELQRARELVDLRRRLWISLLDYPPFAGAIAAHLEAQLRDAPPNDELAQMRQAAIGVRELVDREASERYAAARDRLADALHVHPEEAPLARALALEVRTIAARRATCLLAVRTPPRTSQVFRRYASAVRRAEADLSVARQRFVAANLRLVVRLARRYSHAFLSPADLIQEGTLGLLRAVDGYDPTRGTRFSTYAAWWIRHGVSRALAKYGLTVRVPANVLQLRTQLHRTEQVFVAEHGRSPSDRELASALGLPPKTVANARRVGHGTVELTGDGIIDEQTVDLDGALDQPIVIREMAEVLEGLPGIEGAVIRKRFALDGEEPMTLTQLGEVHSLSRERIRQIEKQALSRMRGELRLRGIEVGV